MRLKLIVSLTPPQTPDLQHFYHQREQAYARVSGALRRFEPFIQDQALVFDGVEIANLADIEIACRATGLHSDLVQTPVFSDDELLRAQYVPLLASGDEIDTDRDGRPLNAYPRALCLTCGSHDLFEPPSPFVVRRPKRTQGFSIWNATNGIRIVTRELWRELAPELASWVTTGDVAYADGGAANELIRLMPTNTIGPYLDHRVLRTCDRCNRPTEIRGGFPNDPLVSELLLVEHRGEHPAPIALIGNWFGSVHAAANPSVSWDVVVSGHLHARLTELRVRGHVKAQRIVNTLQDLPPLLRAKVESAWPTRG